MKVVSHETTIQHSARELGVSIMLASLEPSNYLPLVFLVPAEISSSALCFVFSRPLTGLAFSVKPVGLAAVAVKPLGQITVKCRFTLVTSLHAAASSNSKRGPLSQRKAGIHAEPYSRSQVSLTARSFSRHSETDTVSWSWYLARPRSH